MLEDDSNWITAKEAAQISGYTSAHIIRLAQSGSILAKKEGRLWHVNYASLKQSLVEVERAAQIRRSELRLKRLQELKKSPYEPILGTKMLNLQAFLATGALFMLGGLAGLVFNQIPEADLKPEDAVAGLSYIANQLNEAVPLSQMANIWSVMEK